MQVAAFVIEDLLALAVASRALRVPALPKLLCLASVSTHTSFDSVDRYPSQRRLRGALAALRYALIDPCSAHCNERATTHEGVLWSGA